jgi:hypothetical protein
MSKKSQQIPRLVPLRYGRVRCEACAESISAGMRVAWRRIRGANGRSRKGVHCAACHHDRLRLTDTRKKSGRSGL